MSGFARLIFGQVNFTHTEEYLEFQFKFLCGVLLFGAIATGVFLVAEHSELNPMPAAHMRSMTWFTLASVGLWLALRGRKAWFMRIALCYEAMCLAEYTSALFYVPNDEFRVIWFFTNIPGVYLLLGSRFGLGISLLTVVGLHVANPLLDQPYSPNAMATMTVSLLFLAVFFGLFVRRARSFYEQLQASNRQLYHLAMHDQLTGVLNARAYYQTCDHAIRLSQRVRTPYSVLFIDLDHFKAINDTYGHEAGDKVLKAVAQCIQTHLRASDVLGRIGGEEFCVFLPNTDQDAAVQVGEHVRQAIEALMPAISATKHLKVTASIGAARNQHSDQSMQDIQQQADQAMYLAKRAGRNRVSCLQDLSAAS